MNLHELLTKADLAEFEKRFIERISEFLSSINSQQTTQSSDELLTRRQLLKFLGISENNFKKYLEVGLPFVPVGKRARYSRKAVLKFLENQDRFGL